MNRWDYLRLEGRSGGSATEKSEGLGELAAALIEHGIAGDVYSRYRSSLPGAIAGDCQAAWKAQLQRNLVQQEELRWLGQRCEERGLEPVVLKGAALLGDIYEDPGSRSMADLDLWVKPSDWEPLVKILVDAGYREVEGIRWEANEFKLNLSRLVDGLGIVFELHRKMFYSESRGSQVQWRTEPLCDGMPVSLRKLAREQMLAHLMGHLAYEHTFLKLSWLLDIDRYVRKHGASLDWERVQALCSWLRQSRSAFSVLWAAKRYLGTPVQWNGAGRLPDWLLESLLTEEFLWAPTEHRARYYVVKHLVKDDWREALTYDLLWLRRRAWK
jgi:hypothetical protein